MASAKTVVYDAVMVAYVLIALSIFVPWVLLSWAPHDRLFLSISEFVGWSYSHFCHQLPYRTLYFNGVPMPVCARDASIYVATALGLVFFRLKGRGAQEFKVSWPLLMALFAPTALDGFTQLFGWRESTNLLRLVTGFPYGLGYAYLIAWSLPLVYALLELAGAAVQKDGQVEPVVQRIKKMIWPPF